MDFCIKFAMEECGGNEVPSWPTWAAFVPNNILLSV